MKANLQDLRMLEMGTIRSPKMVYDELTDGNDLLAQWCKHRRKNLSVRANKDVRECFRQIANHVHGKYRPAKAYEFLGGADGWVIAHAMEMGNSGSLLPKNRIEAEKRR